MTLIFSHDKTEFNRVWGFGKSEVFKWSAVLSIIGAGLMTQLHSVFQMISVMGLIIVFGTTALYLIGTTLSRIISKRKNIGISHHIEAIQQAIREFTGAFIESNEIAYRLHYAVNGQKKSMVLHHEELRYKVTFESGNFDLRVYAQELEAATSKSK